MYTYIKKKLLLFRVRSDVTNYSSENDLLDRVSSVSFTDRDVFSFSPSLVFNPDSSRLKQ